MVTINISPLRQMSTIAPHLQSSGSIYNIHVLSFTHLYQLYHIILPYGHRHKYTCIIDLRYIYDSIHQQNFLGTKVHLYSLNHSFIILFPADDILTNQGSGLLTFMWIWADQNLWMVKMADGSIHWIRKQRTQEMTSLCRFLQILQSSVSSFDHDPTLTKIEA